MTPGKGTQEAPADQGPNPPAPATSGQSAAPDQQKPEVPAPGELQKDLATFRTTVNYVIVPVTVLDKKHQQVAGLTYRDFKVYENNVPQNIRLFSADAVPLSV